MSDKKDELLRLKELLAIERQEDLEQFQAIMQQMPLQERASKGYAWYPLEAQKTGYTLGERAFVTVQKEDKSTKHHFRAGMSVNLFNNHPSVKETRSGVIHFVHKNRMKIILNSKDIPDWLGTGKLGVDLLFDERTYIEMEKALDKVINAKGDRLAELRRVLQGKETARFYFPEKESEQTQQFFANTTLNPSQQQAVKQILAAQDVAIIHGPPGTGKTTTITHAIKALAQYENSVLVTAPSNTAVDLLTERLATMELVVVRIGNISRVDESIIRHTLEWRMSEHPESKNIKKLKVKAAEVRRKAKRFRRNFGAAERQERRELYQEAKDMEDWANQLENRILNQILDSANVITCTLVGSTNRVLDQRKFRTVVVDEAAQALEPATWIPIQKASKVVLTGDPYQLPPTVKSYKAAKKGLAITLIEKSLERIEKVNLLNTQYRMHETIMGFSNRQFYQGQLKAADSVRHHQLAIEHFPLVFIDTAGCGFEEKINPQFQSRYNPDEWLILCEHLYLLIDEHTTKQAALPSIGIISPYKEQVLYMQQAIQEDKKLAELPITIQTIDGFQGQERDVIYISLVRSNGKNEIGFLNDYRRMNVAMTRAKKQLVIIGDSATLGGHSFYDDMLLYCEEEGLYQTAWEYMQTME